jgi:hypothetical protein
MLCYTCVTKLNIYAMFSKIYDRSFDEYFCKSCINTILNITQEMKNKDYDYIYLVNDLIKYVNSHITETLMAD